MEDVNNKHFLSVTTIMAEMADTKSISCLSGVKLTRMNMPTSYYGFCQLCNLPYGTKILW